MKKPRFKPRVGYAETVDHDGYSGWYAQPSKDWADQSKATLHRVRITDARDLTAEQSVQKVLQAVWKTCPSVNSTALNNVASLAGFTAKVGVDAKVRIGRIKQ